MFIINNLLLLLEEKGLKQSDLCEAIGISSSTMTNWKNRGTDPPAKYIIPICEFLDISHYRLLTGEERNSQANQLSDDEQELLKIYNNLSNISKAKVKERAEVFAEIESIKADKEPVKTRFIELSPMAVSAGTGETLIDDSYPEFIQVKINDNTREANFAVQINGNSMEPYYKDDDIVLVKSQPEVAIGQIGIFIIDNEGFIKKRGADRLISLNPEYEDVYFMEGQEIWCKGLVTGTLDEDDIIE